MAFRTGQVNGDPWAASREALKDEGLQCGVQCCGGAVVVVVASIALFIIACVGASGAMKGPTIGMVALGLTGVMLLGHVSMGGDFKIRKFDLLAIGVVGSVLVTLGTLGIMGHLSGKQVGWGILGTTVLGSPVVFSVTNEFKKRQVEQLKAGDS